MHFFDFTPRFWEFDVVLLQRKSKDNRSRRDKNLKR